MLGVGFVGVFELVFVTELVAVAVEEDGGWMRLFAAAVVLAVG